MQLKEQSTREVQPRSSVDRLYSAPGEYPNPITAEQFAELVENTEVWERKAVYHRLVDTIQSGNITPEAAISFIRFEPNSKLVHRATSDFIRLKSCSLVNEFAGVEEILELYQQDKIINSGAALAGLLALGDRRVNALLRVMRPGFSLSTLQGFTRIHPGRLCSASIEFYFDWIFELKRKQDTEKLNAVCSAMTVMLFHDEAGYVEDHSELEAVGFKQTTPIRMPYTEYFKSIEPTVNRLLDTDSFQDPAIQALISTLEGHRQISQHLGGQSG